MKSIKGPTDILREDHALIFKVLTSLEKRDDISYKTAQMVVKFFDGFVNELHHNREECVLYKELMKKGVPERFAPFGILLEEHQVDKVYIAKMRKMLPKMKQPGPAKEIFLQNLRCLIMVSKAHMEEENLYVYLMCDHVFSAEEYAKMAVVMETDFPSKATKPYSALAKRILSG